MRSIQPIMNAVTDNGSISMGIKLQLIDAVKGQVVVGLRLCQVRHAVKIKDLLLHHKVVVTVTFMTQLNRFAVMMT